MTVLINLRPSSIYINPYSYADLCSLFIFVVSNIILSCYLKQTVGSRDMMNIRQGGDSGSRQQAGLVALVSNSGSYYPPPFLVLGYNSSLLGNWKYFLPSGCLRVSL